MSITDLVYIDTSGYHFADYPSFLAWLQGQYQGIYGADVYLEADSQDGQFLAILAKAFYDTAALGASVYNSFSPATAQGVGLSRNVKINGLERRIPSHSTVELTIVGQTGTSIVNGVATDSLGQKWLIPTTLIPDSGSVVSTGVAELEGDIAAPANTVNIIFTPTLGWQTVNNATDATPGAPVETDAELRQRQSISTANPSNTVLEGTVGAVANLAGVTKVRGYENDSGTTDVNSIPGHNVSIAVVGGDDVQIASSIAAHKTPGVGTFGNTSETVYDSHGMPLVIQFNRAVTATIQSVITIKVNQGWSNDYLTLIKAAVAGVINAGQIGDPVLLTKLYAPAYLLGTAPGLTYNVVSITLGKNGGSQSAANVTLTYIENPVCVAGTDISIVVT